MSIYIYYAILSLKSLKYISQIYLIFFEILTYFFSAEKNVLKNRHMVS